MAHSGTPRHKVILTGEYGVGKSSLFQLFTCSPFIVDCCEETSLSPMRSASWTKRNDKVGGAVSLTNGYNVLTKDEQGQRVNIAQRQLFARRSTSSTAGLDNYTRQFTTAGGQNVQLQLWDTSGLERFHSLSASYYSGASAVIVCYSVVDQLSLSSAAQYIIEAMDNAGRSSSSCGVCPLVFLCGNKSDLQQLQQSATAAPPGADGARRLMDEYSPIVSRSFVVSSLTGAGIADMFAEIAQTIANRGREKADREATTVCQLRSFLSIGDDKSQSKDCSCG